MFNFASCNGNKHYFASTAGGTNVAIHPDTHCLCGQYIYRDVMVKQSENNMESNNMAIEVKLNKEFTKQLNEINNNLLKVIEFMNKIDDKIHILSAKMKEIELREYE